MKENKSGWQFPKALEIIKCKEGNKEFMKERPARRPFGNTVLICKYPINESDDRAEREVDYMAACEARRTGLLARFLYAFGYRIGGDAWRENRRPRLR